MSYQALDLPNINWPKLRDTILASSVYALTEVNNWCRFFVFLHDVVWFDNTFSSNQASICCSWSFDMHLCKSWYLTYATTTHRKNNTLYLSPPASLNPLALQVTGEVCLVYFRFQETWSSERYVLVNQPQTSHDPKRDYNRFIGIPVPVTSLWWLRTTRLYLREIPVIWGRWLLRWHGSTEISERWWLRD